MLQKHRSGCEQLRQAPSRTLNTFLRSIHVAECFLLSFAAPGAQ